MGTFKHETSRDDSEVEITSIPSQGEVHPPSTGDAKPIIRSRFFIGAGTLLLILVVILVNFTSLRDLTVKLFIHPKSALTVSQTVPTTTPITSPWWMGHDVSAAVVDGVAYVGATDGTVSALRTSEGVLLWRYRTHGAVNGPVLVVNSIVYFSSEDHILYALRASDGALLWHYPIGSIGYVSTLVNGVIYITSQDGTVSALRASDGFPLWQYRTNGSVTCTLIATNGVIYTCSDRQTLYALQANDGTLLWHYTINEHIFSSPVVDNRIVYLNTDEGTVYAFQASNGSLLWHYTPDGGGFGSPIVVNGVVYIGATAYSPDTAFASDAGHSWLTTTAIFPLESNLSSKSGITSVYALRASNGAVLWHHTINASGINNSGLWLMVVNGVIYVGATINTSVGYIYALQSSDGSQLWRSATDGATSWPLVARGIIYVGSLNGSMSALDAANGSLLWHYTILGVVLDTPILDDESVYVGSANSIIYALQSTNGSLRWYYLA